MGPYLDLWAFIGYVVGTPDCIVVPWLVVLYGGQLFWGEGRLRSRPHDRATYFEPSIFGGEVQASGKTSSCARLFKVLALPFPGMRDQDVAALGYFVVVQRRLLWSSLNPKP